MSISIPVFSISVHRAACRLLGAGLPALLLLAGSVPAVIAQDDPLPPDQAELAATLSAQLSGEIRVGGAVLDASTGEPLGRVRLSVTAGAFDPRRPGLRTTTHHKEEVTGAFRYSCNPCTDVRLRLSKNGYRSETLKFAVAAVPGSVVDETRLSVILRPLDAPVILQAIQGELVAGGGADAKVLALDAGNRKARIVGLDRLPPKSADGVDPLVLRLSADTGDDGKALVVEVAEEKAKDAPVVPVHPRPVAAALNLSSIGGVVRHEPEDPRPLAALRSMREAPADGYVQRLELGSVTEPVFFYCRAGERYGKGYVEAPWIDNGGVVRAHVRLWLNDGGRSVEATYE